MVGGFRPVICPIRVNVVSHVCLVALCLAAAPDGRLRPKEFGAIGGLASARGFVSGAVI
jgi:hypothetical protein